MIYQEDAAVKNWKRILSLLLILTMCLSLLPLSAFAEEPASPCEHDYIPTVTEPTCTEGGYTTYVCALCGDSYVDDATDPAHRPEEAEATASTCTTHGHTAGAVCAVCGVGLEGCEELPLAAHEPEAVAAVSPTCTRPGHTEGAVCAACGEVLEGCEEIPATEHTPREVEAVSPTLDKPGSTAGTVCAVCGEVLSGCEEIPATGVTVRFLCGKTDELSGLTVFDAEEKELTPITDAESGEAVPGRYLLAPGLYTYSFHDKSGKWMDVEATEVIVTGDSETQDVELELKAALRFELQTVTAVNPLYADVVDESEIPAGSLTEESLEALFSAPTEQSGRKRGGENGTTDAPYTSVNNAAAGLREALRLRQANCEFYYTPSAGDNPNTLAGSVFELALAHTGNGDEGDYIRFTYGGWECQIGSAIDGNGQVVSYYFSYNLAYYTTSEQEQAMTVSVNQILSGLGLSGMSQDEQIQAIYAYLCENVTYDFANLNNSGYKLKYSGYAALVNRTAVCQGIANAFYRLCLTAGIDARIIHSDTQDHAWNIVSCGGRYYELDATWDLGKTTPAYGFFMLGRTNWLAGHKLEGSGYSTLGDEFNNNDFASAYSIPNDDYVMGSGGSGSASSGVCGDPSVNSGADVTWRLSRSGVLTISGTGAMAAYSAGSPAPWHGNDAVVSAMIGEGVTNIGAYAFADCTGLKNVTIPVGVTEVGAEAFSGCSALAKIYYYGTEQQWDEIEIGDGNEPLLAAQFRYNCAATALDEDNFPDPAFRAYVLENADTNKDNTLSFEETAAVTAIDVEGLEVASLDGIAFFTNLESLNCSSNNLESLDLSGNTELRTLYCTENRISDLNISSCTALEELVCWSNRLTALNVGGFPNLRVLGCGDNLLETLDVSSNTALTELYCERNQLTALNVANNSVLTDLECYSNQLTALDVSRNPELTYLCCSINEISAIDLSSSPNLTILYIDQNRLTTLDLSHNTALTQLWVCINPLSSLNVSSCPALCDVIADGYRSELYYKDGNYYSFTKDELSLEVDVDVALTPASSGEGVPVITAQPVDQTVRFGGNASFTVTAVGQELQYLWMFSEDGGNDFQEVPAELYPTANTNTLSWENVDLTFDGLMFMCVVCNDVGAVCTNAVTLNVDDPTITVIQDPIFRDWVDQNVDADHDGTLSAAELAAVTTIDVSDMGIQSLQGIEFFPSLTSLTCYGNELTSLDVSQNTELVYLNCGSVAVNPVSGETVLRSNRLTQLTLGNKPSLQTLLCYGNQLTALDLSQAPELTELGCSTNCLTALDLSALTKLQSLYCADNQMTSLNVRSNTELEHIQCSANRLTSMDFHGMNKLIYVDVAKNQLVSLNLMGCTALQTLNCYENRLATLDLHTNTALTGFSCSNNLLTTLDLSYNTALEGFLCDFNRLTSLILGQDENLVNFGARSNQLTALDVSGLTNLQVLGVGGNKLTSLDLSLNPELQRLHCWGNQLTTLDLSGNAELDYLQCSGNRLTALDLSNCPKLLQVMNNNPQTSRKGPSGAACASYGDPAALSDYLEFDSALLKKGLTANPELAVNETNFPDETFRAYVAQKIDTDRSGGLSKAEIAAVKEINVPNMGIHTLEGIEFFTVLERLYCYDNSLTALDLSANTNLQLLSVGWVDLSTGSVTESHGNHLGTLDLSRNTRLTVLYAASCELTNLDLSRNTALVQLYCENNSLTDLNLSRNTRLERLSCSDNALTSLNLTANTALTYLYACRNDLTSLDVSRNTRLWYLGVSYNPLTALNVSKNTLLERLICCGTSIESLDVSRNTKLKTLSAQVNRMTSLTLGKLNALEELLVNSNDLSALDLSGTPNVTTLSTVNNPRLTQLDLRKTPGLMAAYAGDHEEGSNKYSVSSNGEELYVLCIDDGTRVILTGDVPINAANFPDANFRAFVSSMIDDGDGTLTLAEIEAVAALRMDGRPIANLKGIEIFHNLETLSLNDGGKLGSLDVTHNPKLTALSVRGNVLSGLDLSRNSALVSLEIANNRLSKLDLSRNGDLSVLACGNNQLTALDVSANPALATLICSNNKLRELPLSANPELEELACDHNQLAVLDVSDNTKLRRIDCQSNKLTALDVSGLTALQGLACSDNLLTGLDLRNNGELFNLECVHNKLNALDIKANPTLVATFQSGSILKQAGTITHAYADGETGVTGRLYYDNGVRVITGKTIAVDAANFPDAGFRGFVGQFLDNDPRDGELSPEEIASVMQINCANGGIASLKGVELFTSLAELNCAGNDLTELDLSGCANLTTVGCSGNRLTAIKLPGNGVIRELDCSGNRLKALDLGGSPALQTLNCAGNQLSALDLSRCPQLTALDLSQNQVSKLDLSHNPALQELRAVQNRLTVMDLSAVTGLETLNISSNRLRGLDLSANAALTELVCDNCGLSALNLSGNPDLAHLSCVGNALTKLDLRANSALASLDCASNRLTELTLGRKDALTDLNCTGNKLTTLEVSRCGELLKAANAAPVLANGVFTREAYEEGAPAAWIRHDSSMILLTSPNGGLCGAKLVWSLSDDGVLSIGGTGAMTQFSAANPAPWSAFAPYIGTVEIGSGVTGIGAFAFVGCDNIEVVLTGNMPGIAATAFSGVTAVVRYPGTSSSYTAAKKTNYGGTLEWVPEGGFQIVLDPNGGRFSYGLVHTLVKFYGQAVNLSNVTPVRPGYTFLGWANAANAAKANYQPGGKFTENANRTLFAVWRAEAYTVRFDANLEGATGAMADQTFSFGKAAALRANAFRKTGCVFLGWAFDPDAEQPDFKDKQTVTDLITPESGERTVTLYGVWATLTTTLEIWVNPPGGEVNLTGQTLDVDMSWLDGTDLYIKTSEGSSQAVSWTSTAPAVARVDANGHVAFLKPGTAIIKVSATDGSRLSASVKFNVYYITPAQRLTARLADTTGEYGVNPGIGLQVGDRVPVEVFGSDPSTPLDPGLFQYDVVTAGGSSFLRFTKDGELESVAAGKTIAVKMTLLGDPLKRSVTLNVKTVPIQTRSVRLIPAPQTGEIDGVWFLDASGEPTDSYEQAAAIYMSSSDTARRLTLVPVPTGVDGDGMPLAANSFSYATTSSAVASVSPIRSGDELGCVSVTIPARAAGACTITATSTDLTRVPASISIYVADYAPRTDVTRVTLDTFDPDGGAEVPLVVSYGNTITDVSFLDAGYDRASGRYTESTGRIEAELEDGGSGEVSRAVIRSGRGIPNAVINGQLCIQTDKGEFYLPLAVACKSPAPQIKFTQQRAFNVFYANEMVPFGWSSSDSWISNIELESGDFEGSWSNGHDFSIRFRDGRASAAPNVRATLKVYFGNNTYPDGAKHPYEIPITISTVTQRPALKLEKSALVYNLRHGTAKIGLGILDSSGTRCTLSDDTDIWLSSNSFAEMQVEDGQPCVVVTNPDSAGGRLTLYLQAANWTSPLSFPLTLTRTGAVPTLSVKPATVILNSNWPDTTVYTSVVSSQANTDIDLSTAVITAPGGMEDKLTFTSGYVPLDGGEITLSSEGALSPQEPISGSAPSAGIENEAGRSGFLGVRIAAGKQVPNGTYKYTFKPEGLPAFTMNVQVVNTLPTLRLQTPTLTLGGFNGDWFWENNEHSTAHAYTGFSLSNPEMPVSSFQFTAVGANAAEAESILDVAYDTESGRIHVSFRDGESPMRTGTYVFAVKAIMEGGIALNPVNLTVKLKDDRPVCPFASSLKWNYSLNRNLLTSSTGVRGGFIGTDYTISVRAECSSTSAAVRAEAQKIGYRSILGDADANGIRTHDSLFYLIDQPAVGSYPFNLWPTWTQNGYTLVYKPVPVTVKVENSLPKVSLTSPTLVLNRQVALSGVSFVNIQSNFDPRYSNVEYSFVGFSEIMDGTYSSSQFVDLSTEDNILKATLTEDGRSAARNADYRITLTPVVTDGYMDVTCAPITLIVRNTSTAARTATVSLSGKLDTVLRDTDAGRMTLTLTGFNGVQGEPDAVVLIGPNAELFTLVGGGFNARGQFCKQLSLRDDLSYRANVSYGGLQLRLHYPDGTEVDSQKFSVRVTQSALKLSSPQATQTFYQSQSRSRWVNYVVNIQTPNGAAIESIEVGDIRLWQNALKDMASDIDFSVSGNSAVVRVRLADTSKLVAGKTYTLPLLVTPAASADNVAPTRINLTLSVKK